MTHVDEVYEGFRLEAQHLPDLLGWTPEEVSVRRDLAAAYQLCARFGWDDLVYTHISARVPGPADHFLVNPLGLGFDEITASSLIKIDLDGNVIGDSIGGYAPNAAGFVIHGGIHQVRADAGCIMHLHTEAQMALSALECGLLPMTQHAMRFHGRIGYHDYEGIALSKDERVRFIDDLGDHNALILRNHGSITVGESVGQAFVEMFYLEKAAKSQLLAQATGLPLRAVPIEVIELTARQWGSQLNTGIEWPALLRRLDAAGSTYAVTEPTSERPGAGRMTFQARWSDAVATHADSTFLRFEEVTGETSEWTYAEFGAVVDAVAATLAALGVGAGDSIHVALRNCPAFVAIWLAVTDLGAWIVPVDPASAARDIERQVERVRPTVGICATARADVYRTGLGGSPLTVLELTETAADVAAARG